MNKTILSLTTSTLIGGVIMTQSIHSSSAAALLVQGYGPEGNGGFEANVEVEGLTNSTPKIKFSNEERALWLMTAGEESVSFWGLDGKSPTEVIGAPARMQLSRTGDLQITGTLSHWSDRSRKTVFASADPVQILENVTKMPIAIWSYTNSPSIRHLGPMAQDFHAAFGVGEDDEHIATVDADGVALAAIQGLNQKLEADIRAKDSKINSLEERLVDLEQALAAMKNENQPRNQ